MGHWTGRAADSRCGFAGKQSVLPDMAPGVDWPATNCHTDNMCVCIYIYM